MFARNLVAPSSPPLVASASGYVYMCRRCDVRGAVTEGKEIVCWCCGERDQLVHLGVLI